MITPFLIVPVAAALLFKHAIYNPIFGLLNGVITWVWGIFGSDNAPQVDWITQFPLTSIEVTLIWQWTPFMTLILLAGLQSRPGEVLEAASVDGANHWQMFTHMTLPHMRQYLELAGLLGCIYVVQTFDAVYTITSGALGTANLPFTIYQTLFTAQDYGLASAQGVIVVLGSILDRHLRGEERLQPALGGRRQMTTTAPTTPQARRTRPAPEQTAKARTGSANPPSRSLTWIIGLIFITPGGVDGADQLPLRDRRRVQPTGHLRAAHPGRLPRPSSAASPVPAPGRR